MSSLYDIIIRPTLTEKSTQMGDDNKYVFRVKYDATKTQIREAVETIFGVDVVKVNTMIMPGKPKRVRLSVGRRNPWKKAVITVAEDQMIDLFALESAEPTGEV
jgi:large subunit ribosomal protein L23